MGRLFKRNGRRESGVIEIHFILLETLKSFYKKVDIVYDIITSVEFWISFIITQFINESLKLKTMNILKIVIVGVGAIVWSHKQVRLVKLNILD